MGRARINTDGRNGTVGTVEVRGKELTVSVDRWGTFYLTDDSDEIIGTGPELDYAVERAAATLAKRRVKVAVPFLRWERDKFRQGIATGRNIKTRHVLARIDDQAVQLDQYRLRAYDAAMPEAAQVRLAELRAQIADLENEAAGIEHQWQIRLGDLVDAAVQDAVEKQAASA